MDIQDTEPRSTGEPQGTASPISRRTVVAVGVTTAWAIPLIQLATAAPAAAASGLVLTFSTPGSGVYGRTGQTLTLRITGAVKNTSAKSAIVKLVITMPGGVSTTAPTHQGSPSPTPWGVGAISWTAVGNSSTISYSATILAGATLSFTGILLKLTSPGPLGKGVAFDPLSFLAQDTVAPISSGNSAFSVLVEP